MSAITSTDIQERNVQLHKSGLTMWIVKGCCRKPFNDCAENFCICVYDSRISVARTETGLLPGSRDALIEKWLTTLIMNCMMRCGIASTYIVVLPICTTVASLQQSGSQATSNFQVLRSRKVVRPTSNFQALRCGRQLVRPSRIDMQYKEVEGKWLGHFTPTG